MKEYCALPSADLRDGEDIRQEDDACSEKLLRGQDSCDDETAFEEEEICADQHQQSWRRLRLLIALGGLMIIGLCCVLYAAFSLTDDFNNKHFHPNNTTTTADMKLQLIIPSYTPHFPVLLEMLHSMACLITDISAVNIAVILSSEAEIATLKALLDDPSQTQTCTSTYLNYNTTHSADLTYPPKLTLHNLYNIIPTSIQGLTAPEDTSGLVKAYGKYKYQSLKKLAAAAYFDYDYAMLLDSEGFVIRPVEFKEMVREWVKGPVIWKELAAVGSPRRNNWIASINEAGAHTLGRTMQNFGPGVSFWEGYTWILEKEIVTDMVTSPSRFDPDADFFTRLLHASTDIFEIVMYKIHVAGRKMEQSSTNSSLYTKYRILDMQETLVDFSLEAAYNRIPGNLDVISERFPFMILEESLQDRLVKFVKEYKLFFMCFHPEYVTMIPRAILESFLRKAPIAMMVSNESGLKAEVIPNGQGAGEWNMTYL